MKLLNDPIALCSMDEYEISSGKFYMESSEFDECKDLKKKENDEQSWNNNSLSKDELFGFSSFSSRDNSPKAASLRSASHHHSHDYNYDVLLIYDPEQDCYNAEKLIELIKPQELRIYNFSMDSRAGMSQREAFAKALDKCEYTCIVVTRNFIENYWLKFKTDMAIQKMLDDPHKRYSLIIIVMDVMVKKLDLPLELQVLAPIFESERYFLHRLSNAFKGSPFAPNQNRRTRTSSPSNSDYRKSPSNQHSYTSQPTASFPMERNGKSSTPIADPTFNFSPRSFSSLNSIHSNVASLSKQDSYSSSYHPSQAYVLDQTSCLDIFTSSNTQGRLGQSTKKVMDSEDRITETIKRDSSMSSCGSSRSRVPQEHLETVNSKDLLKNLAGAEYQRSSSITQNSSGHRRAVETDDESMSNAHSLTNNNIHSSLTVTSLPESNSKAHTSCSFTQGISGPSTQSSLQTEKKLSLSKPQVGLIPAQFQASTSPATSLSSRVVTDSVTNNLDDDSIGNITLEISAEELPRLKPPQLSGTVGIQPEVNSDSEAKPASASDQDDSILSSIKQSFLRFKNKIKSV